MSIQIHSKIEEEIWQKAAESLIISLDGRLKSRKKVLLLLSGGSVVEIYKRIKSRLSGIPQKAGNNELRIADMAIGQVDERFRPESNNPITTPTNNPISNENINATQIEKTGLWEACGKKNIPYYLISQEGTLEEAAEKYNKIISKLFKEYNYKIAVLGIGEDAHTAGLLPGYENMWNKEKLVVGYDLGQNNPRGLSCQNNIKKRITVTPNALLRLDYAIVVAIGENKSWAIEKAFDPVNQVKLDKYPAAIIQKIKKVDLFTPHQLVKNMIKQK